MAECFICKNLDATMVDIGTLSAYDCEFCGEYQLDDTLEADIYKSGITENQEIFRIKAKDFYFKAPGIAAERRLKGMDKYLLAYDDDLSSYQNANQKSFTPIGIKAFLGEYPQDAIDMFNRILVNLGRLISHPTDKFELVKDNAKNYILPMSRRNHKSAYFYSENYDKALEICQELVGARWLRLKENEDGFSITITPEGWLVLRELQKTSKNSDKVFLAMWFSDKEPQLGMLREAVKDAVHQAGYNCTIVDEIHHNDYIMNKVLTLIKDSCFVIADFTFAPEGSVDKKGKISGGVRGGVYYEAGFAKGLGLPVIASCRKDDDSEARIHFDIEQLNTIFWQQNGDKLTTTKGKDFVEFLKRRIVDTVGKGKHYIE